MYARLLEMYCAGTITDSQLDAAVSPKRWITADQAEAIRAEKARRDAVAQSDLSLVVADQLVA